MLDDIELSEDRARKIADALNQIEREAKAAHRQEVSQFKAELGKLEGREDELYDAYTEGVLDKAGYKRQLERLRQEKRRYADLAGEAHFDITDATLVTAKKLIELARDVKSLWRDRNPHERRKLLEEVVSNPVLDEVTVRYDLKKPFLVLVKNLKNSKKEGWRTREDSNLRPTDS